MKFDFIKNRVLFVSICIFLATVLVLLSVWKQQVPTVEGMAAIDFTKPLDKDGKTPTITDMDIQEYVSSIIPFEKKFETEDKSIININAYKGSFIPGGSLGDVNTEGISAESLENFIKHLKNTSQSFKNFADALDSMKKEKTEEYEKEKKKFYAKAPQV